MRGSMDSSEPGYPPRGYRSEQSKRTFCIWTGVLGAVFFFAQFLVPMIAMMSMMPVMMTSHVSGMSEVHLGEGAVWDGKLCYMEVPLRHAGAGQSKALLRCITPEGEGLEEPGTPVDLERAQLLAGLDRLWFVSSRGVGSLREGQITISRPPTRLGNTGPAFLHEGAPAVLEHGPEGIRFMVFAGGDWAERQHVAVPEEFREGGMVGDRIQALSREGRIDLFLRFGNAIYHHEGLPGGDEADTEAWNLVEFMGRGRQSADWHAALVGGEPSVFVVRNLHSFDTRIEGMRRIDGHWDTFFGPRELHLMGSFGLFPLGEQDHFAVAVQGFPGSLRILDVRDGKVEATFRHGHASVFPPGMFLVLILPYAFILILPVLLAIILARLMSSHRTEWHVRPTAAARYASLTQRAFACIIDMAIAWGPVIVGYVIMLAGFMDMEEVARNPQTFLFAPFGLVFGGLCWALFAFLLFTWTEGNSGTTPGKYALGICVLGSEDLLPCGFGRALIRNLLQFADGFFSFLVGILVVAFSDKWQRVGDMAARTVVVRSSEIRSGDGEAGPTAS